MNYHHIRFALDREKRLNLDTLKALTEYPKDLESGMSDLCEINLPGIKDTLTNNDSKRVADLWCTICHVENAIYNIPEHSLCEDRKLDYLDKAGLNQIASCNKIMETIHRVYVMRAPWLKSYVEKRIEQLDANTEVDGAKTQSTFLTGGEN